MNAPVVLPALAASFLTLPGCPQADPWVHHSTYERQGFEADIPPAFFPLAANRAALPSPYRARLESIGALDDDSFTTQDLRLHLGFHAVRWSGACANWAKGVEVIGGRKHDVETKSGAWVVQWSTEPTTVDLSRCVDDELWRISVGGQAELPELQAIAETIASSAQLSSPPPRAPRPARLAR